MEQATLKSKITGPRWARFDLFIIELARRLNIEYDVDRRKSFLSEHVFYTLKGDADKLKLAQRNIDNAINKWNADD